MVISRYSFFWNFACTSILNFCAEIQNCSACKIFELSLEVSSPFKDYYICWLLTCWRISEDVGCSGWLRWWILMEFGFDLRLRRSRSWLVSLSHPQVEIVLQRVRSERRICYHMISRPRYHQRQLTGLQSCSILLFISNFFSQGFQGNWRQKHSACGCCFP